MGNSYFDLYREYTKETECPHFFHRWGAISSLAAFIGRDCYFRHGHFNISPNIYCMLIGNPGTRKSTAIKIAKNLVVAAGYEHIAAEKTSKEKFLVDLAAQNDHSLLDDSEPKKRRNGVDILEENLWGERDYESMPPAEVYIAADEFNDFIGTGNLEFISLLGNLWDFAGVFKQRVKNSKSIAIPNPTVNLFGGNTPVGFSACFPPETLGQGFLSRLLLIYGEETGRRITFPKPPDPAFTEFIISELVRIKNTVRGMVTLEPKAEALLDKIYQTFPPLDDPRFASYSNRRFTHLLKLCIVCTASRCAKEITEQDVLLANTILAHTEDLMPKALGEFGKSRDSDVVHEIMTILDNCTQPIKLLQLWEKVYMNLDNIQKLQQLMAGLQAAGRVQVINNGYLPKKSVRKTYDPSLVDFNLLTEEERNGE